MTAAVAPRVIEAITDLGDTPDAIADRLRALGIKGRPGACDTSPLARFIQTIPGAGDAYAGYDTVDLRNGEAPLDLPEAAVEFGARFDRGVYLDLIDMDVQATTEPRGGWQEQIEGGAR
jgi:hypothetical protein